MIEKWLDNIQGKELKIFSIFSVCLLFVVSFVIETPLELVNGMMKIIISRDALITDYFALAGYGAAFFNVALVVGLELILIITQKIPFTGFTMAALYINAGYALWGKNPINILPILFGTILYAKVHRVGLNRYIYVALFGTCLAPFVTEMVYILPFHGFINLLIAVGLGIFIGYLLPPLSMHTASMHMGYNLFNVGFSGGILAFIIVCVIRSFGIESEPIFIWKEGINPGIAIGFYVYCLITILFGVFINRGKIAGMKKLIKHPGRAVADFVLMDGVGTTLINMGTVGMFCATYILFIQGDFSGPVLGAILTAFGFAAFGVHVKNYFPVLAGVFLYTFVSQYDVTTPGIQLAAIFGVGLAPIAGQFGMIAGIIAGMLHSCIVMYTADMYGGLNLYNNGFSAGWVAIIMIPALESFMTQFKERKGRKT